MSKNKREWLLVGAVAVFTGVFVFITSLNQNVQSQSDNKQARDVSEHESQFPVAE